MRTPSPREKTSQDGRADRTSGSVAIDRPGLRALELSDDELETVAGGRPGDGWGKPIQQIDPIDLP